MTIEIQKTTKVRNQDLKGILSASTILTLWVGNLSLLILFFDVTKTEFYLFILLQSFLNIGLFITAHDSMHGSLSPTYPKINQAFGTISLFLYSGFSFTKLQSQHILHHSYPASDLDPDFARSGNEKFIFWLYDFIRNYFGLKQFLFIIIPVILISFLTQSYLTMLLIYALPSITSALQLFYFGTYLPHRTPSGGHTHPDRTTSNHYPTWLSFITCYHFGYHQEHHEKPSVPWWKLPEVHQSRPKPTA